ncbi:hypothetical protein RM53_06780 [Brevundimonas nasdae]|uniref:Uncharacterized protein n=1 Tax=Brevundimonas nasdae TaxID=172043 RepID=A0A0B4CX34_9CAUL|nr:hypothetical protein [Brevundimonas nasdae]KIC58901.1 hypothetical protein RM53_06780 [Brevundimonas nasdae]
MKTAQAALFIAGWFSLATGMVSSMGAHLAADHSRRNGLVPRKTPDFYDFSKNVFSFGIGPSFRTIFSDVHRQYKSRFITRCVKVSRVAFVLAAAFLAAFVISLIIW